MLLITAALLFFTYFKRMIPKKYFLYRCNSYRLSSGSSHTSRNFKVRIYNFHGFTFKCKREKATKFSFLMVLVPIFGILILKSIKGFTEISETSNLILFDSSYVFGFISALFSGVLHVR